MTTEKIYHVEFKKNFECLPNVIIKKGEKRFYAEDKIDSILKLFASKMNIQKIIVPFENNIMKISKHNKIDLDTLKTYPDYIQFKKLIDSNEFFQKLNYLAARWMDEYEYEDKKEYKKKSKNYSLKMFIFKNFQQHAKNSS